MTLFDKIVLSWILFGGPRLTTASRFGGLQLQDDTQANVE
ncbi:hypothetical protein PC128_g25524 [Phytophthora cactorum]|nr:hypothetical protein PC128_g25524 [Phytophthora cactorum]